MFIFLSKVIIILDIYFFDVFNLLFFSKISQNFKFIIDNHLVWEEYNFERFELRKNEKNADWHECFR